jgi:1-acyl-sn-glycerol-3-phosphate acyltransferase
MNEFRGGITRILERTPVPVIPMALSGLWRSLFTRNRARLRHLTRIFPTIRLAVGNPVAPDAAAPEALHAAVRSLRGDWR